MFDIQQRTTLGELSTPFIKYVVWSADMNHVALLSKHAIIIADKKLGNASTGESSLCLLTVLYNAVRDGDSLLLFSMLCGIYHRA